MDTGHLPASWANDTVLAIGDSTTRIGDGILVVDDFVPRGTSQEISRKQSEAQSLFQLIGNYAGRQRLNPDGSPRPSNPPNCLVISTGEDRVLGGSADARTLPVRFTTGMVDKPTLRRCQRDASRGLYAASMAGFLRWLAPQLDDIRAGLAAGVPKLRDELFREGDHGRTPEILAHLRLGAGLFLRFAQELGAITEGEHAGHLAGVEAGLARASAEVRSDLAEEPGPCELFIRLVRNSLASGKTYLIDAETGAMPGGRASECGWKLVIQSDRGVDCRDWEPWPNAERIGWTDGKTVFLHPENSYAAARRAAEAGGQGFGTTKQSLHKLLLEGGMVDRAYGAGSKKKEGIRQVGRAKLGPEGKRADVHAIPAWIFWGEDRPKQVRRAPAEDPARDEVERA